MICFKHFTIVFGKTLQWWSDWYSLISHNKLSITDHSLFKKLKWVKWFFLFFYLMLCPTGKWTPWKFETWVHFYFIFYFWEECIEGTNHTQMSLQQGTEIHSDKTCWTLHSPFDLQCSLMTWHSTIWFHQHLRSHWAWDYSTLTNMQGGCREWPGGFKLNYMHISNSQWEAIAN